MVTSRADSKRTRIVLSVVVVVAILVAALILYEYQQSNSTKGATATLNGSAYYSTTVPVAANLTALTFQGVRFSFTLGIQYELPFGNYTDILNGTTVTVPCPPGVQGGAELCDQSLPQIQISFPDDNVEYFNKATVVNTSVTYQRPTSFPWFSIHTDPRVAIMLNTHAPTASLTLYVSA